MILLGKNLNPFKRVCFALTAFDDVGLKTAKDLCDRALVHPLAKVRELQEIQVVRLKASLQPKLEAQRQKKLSLIKSAKSIPKPIMPM